VVKERYVVLKGDIMLEETLRKDLKKAMLAKDDDTKNAIKMVLSEIPRLNKRAGEKATDAEIVGIMNRLIKSETIVLEYSKIHPSESVFINTLLKYVPKMMSEEEISKWIDDNIDLTSFPNKMSAMKPIMMELKGEADGNVVKKVLQGK
jgi:uncharacterized protein YqeY